jgi:hypothetical protein
VERPEPQAAINDVVVRIHASGFVPTEMAWPSTWTDRLDRDRTPSMAVSRQVVYDGGIILGDGYAAITSTTSGVVGSTSRRVAVMTSRER